MGVMEVAMDRGILELRRVTEILTQVEPSDIASGFLRNVPLALWGKRYEEVEQSFRMVFISDKYTEVFGIESDDYLKVMWDGGKWRLVANNGCVGY